MHRFFLQLPSSPQIPCESHKSFSNTSIGLIPALEALSSTCRPLIPFTNESCLDEVEEEGVDVGEAAAVSLSEQMPATTMRTTQIKTRKCKNRLPLFLCLKLLVHGELYLYLLRLLATSMHCWARKIIPGKRLHLAQSLFLPMSSENRKSKSKHLSLLRLLDRCTDFFVSR